MKRWIKVAAVLGVIAAGLYIGRRQAMQLIGDVLVRDDVRTAPQAEPARFAMILMGDTTGTRADKGLSLYRDHQAQKLIVAQTRKSDWVAKGIVASDTEIHARYLIAQGVPAADVIVLSECKNTSTYDDAICLRNFLRTQGKVDRVIIVTSWYHTGRAGWLFDRLLRPIRVDMAAAAGPESHPQGYYRNRDDSLMVVMEYLKWAYWRVTFSNWES